MELSSIAQCVVQVLGSRSVRIPRGLRAGGAPSAHTCRPDRATCWRGPRPRPGIAALLSILISPAIFLAIFLALAAPASPQDAELGAEKGEQLFAQVDEMLAVMSKMTGLETTRPIKRSIITREQIRDLVESRLKEETTPEAIRAEELTLKMFGFVNEDFDLAKQYVDVLAEQATALYDYQTKQLYLATWTPEDLQEVALVHELAHALADQHFDLGKYLSKSRGADGDLARSAVIEGQASWIMVEYAMRQSGKSMVESPLLAVTAASASRFEAGQYPTYASAPLYIRESLLFPYTEGLLFQQAIIEKHGAAGFSEVFREPPISSQQILDPDAYFEHRIPTKPRIPRVRLGRGYKTISQGEIGQWDHSILLKQFVGEEEARDLSPHWRGAYYKLRENKARSQLVLAYAVDWSSPERARRYFELYREICEKKWQPTKVEENSAGQVVGQGDKSGFLLTLNGRTVTSIEGLPNDRLETHAGGPRRNPVRRFPEFAHRRK